MCSDAVCKRVDTVHMNKFLTLFMLVVLGGMGTVLVVIGFQLEYQTCSGIPTMKSNIDNIEGRLERIEDVFERLQRERDGDNLDEDDSVLNNKNEIEYQ